jgi:hypothetical protein
MQHPKRRGTGKMSTASAKSKSKAGQSPSPFRAVNFNNQEYGSQELSSHSSFAESSESASNRRKNDDDSTPTCGHFENVGSSREQLNQLDFDLQQEKAIQQILSREFFTNQTQRDLLKIVRCLERRISFFNHKGLEANDYEKVQLSQVSAILDRVRIEKKAILENYVKEFLGDPVLKRKQNKYAVFAIHMNYVDLEASWTKEFKALNGSLFLKADFPLIFDKFRLDELKAASKSFVDELMQSRRDYIAWKRNQLSAVAQSNLIGPKFLHKLQNDVFWDREAEMVA